VAEPPRDTSSILDPADEELLASIGTAFSKLRRRTMSVAVDPPVAPTDLRRDMMLTAVEEGSGQLTVSALATKLMMDQPAASRLTASGVEQGLDERVASQTDGRSVTLRLTPRGKQVLTHSRHQQRQAFEHITRDWEPAERVLFARLLHKYVQATAELP
jgi:DNA-binding MarR family transcriptional regulator